MTRRVVILALFALMLAVAAPARAQQATRYILRAPATLVSSIADRHGLTVASVLRDGPEQIVLVDAPPTTTADVLEQEVEGDNDVIGFERDRIVSVPELAAAPALSQSTAVILEGLGSQSVTTFFGTAAPSTYTGQPAASIVRLTNTWPIATGAGTVVAVIDTGVDATHSLLGASVLPGYDFTRNLAGEATDLADLAQSTAVILEQSTANILSQNQVVALTQSTAVILEQSTAVILEGTSLPAAFGHGTMVAGLVHLAAPGAAILPLKAFRADGTSNLSDVIRAVYYAADNGANVINMSFSMRESSQELMRAVDYATSRNVVCVAAAGNDGREIVVYPGGYRNVISVASTTNADVRSTFSNYGDANVSLAAPGELLTTTFPGQHYAVVSGTSFSTAIASGGVALLHQIHSTETISQAAGDLARGPSIGQGLGDVRIDLYSAVQKAASRK